MSRHFNVTVNGVDYQVAVKELDVQPATTAAPAKTLVAPVAPVVSAPAPAPSAAPVAAASAGTHVVAQMGGSIATILVKQGQAVSKGDKVIELEAMKMKIPVVASESGSVTIIMVAEGDPVEIGQTLITIG